MASSRLPIAERIKEDLEVEGYEPGSPSFKFLLLERKVEYCQVRHNVTGCPQCKYYDYCELAKKYLRVINGIEPPDED